MKSEQEVRVRFAPSPTGPLHIGGLRTAMYNYLFAKRHKGKFVIRIEDTDQTRFVPGAEDYIFKSLEWSGLMPNEGMGVGGDYGPYKQSERKEIYQKYAQDLIDKGHAYYAFDTPEELDAMREKLKEMGSSTLAYNAASRTSMKNSFTLSEDKVEENIKTGKPYVIRLNVDPKNEISFSDQIRGTVNVHTSTLDDKVIMKSDGLPTYHLANVVDDHLMKISHVIRGEEWLPSTPIHVLLYQALGWENEIPEFAHLPLILKPDGKGKLSKRDGDKHGFPVFPLAWNTGDDNATLGFREAGYMPEAFVNFLAFIGWNPGGEQELFDLDELGKIFSLERVNKAGAKFDIEKAVWFNQQYIKNAVPTTFAKELKEQLDDKGIAYQNFNLEDIVSLLQERVNTTLDFVDQSAFFFSQPNEFDRKVIKKKWNDKVAEVLSAFAQRLSGLSDATSDTIQAAFQGVCEENEIKPGAVMQSLRVALTGKGGGPDLMKIIAIMGMELASSRILASIEKINVEKESITQ